MGHHARLVDKSHIGQTHLERAEEFINRSPDFKPNDCAVITAGQLKDSATPRGTNLVKIYWK